MTNQDFKTDSDTGGLTASDQVDIRKNRVHVLKTNKRTMAAGKSVAEQLLNALKMTKHRPMPSYISEADPVSIDDLTSCSSGMLVTMS